MDAPSPQRRRPALKIALIASVAVVAVALLAALAVALVGVDKLTEVLPGSTNPPVKSRLATTTDSDLPPELQGMAESEESSSATGTTPIDKNKRYVPNVTQLTYAEAARLVKLTGLVPVEKKVSGKRDDDAKEPGIVYRVTPEPGTYVQKGTKVELRYYK